MRGKRSLKAKSVLQQADEWEKRVTRLTDDIRVLAKTATRFKGTATRFANNSKREVNHQTFLNLEMASMELEEVVRGLLKALNSAGNAAVQYRYARRNLRK